MRPLHDSCSAPSDRPARLVSYVGDPEDDRDSDDLEAGSDDMDISRSDDESAEQGGAGDGPAAADGELIPPEPPGRCSKELQVSPARSCGSAKKMGCAS